MAKALNQNGLDGEGRKLGYRTGLDTRVVLAANVADLVLLELRVREELKANCQVRRLGSTTARLKL